MEKRLMTWETYSNIRLAVILSSPVIIASFVIAISLHVSGLVGLLFLLPTVFIFCRECTKVIPWEKHAHKTHKYMWISEWKTATYYLTKAVFVKKPFAWVLVGSWPSLDAFEKEKMERLSENVERYI